MLKMMALQWESALFTNVLRWEVSIDAIRINAHHIAKFNGHMSCYPTIKGIKFVCCDINSKKYDKHKESITELWDILCDVASETKLAGYKVICTT